MSEENSTEMECAEVLELLSEFVDGGLDQERHATIETHLGTCENCSRFGKSFGGMLRALANHQATASSGDSEVVEQILAAIAKSTENAP